MSLGFRLKREREKRGWSQKYVAKKIGITNTVLSNYERDYRDPDTDTLRKLAELYEVSVDYLLCRTNNKDIELTEKDERDIAKRMEQIKKDLTKAEGLSFHGEPLSEEAVESLLEAIEHAERIATLANKKYIPKKYRDNK